MSNELTVKMSKTDIKAFKSNLKSQAKLTKKYNVKNIQSERFMRDSVTGDLVGVSQMNTLLHGWDGRFDNGTPFENKNVSSTVKSVGSLAFKLQDTSVEKLNEAVTTPVLGVTSAWGDGSEPDFIILGTTNMVGEQLKKSYNPETRRSCSASLACCLKNGFKIVAVNYDKEQVLDTIANLSVRLGKTLTFDDIYTKKDIPALVSEMI